MTRRCWLPVWSLVFALVLPTIAQAQVDEEEDILIEDDEGEPLLREDNAKIYSLFKEEVEGLPELEEIDAWHDYLDEYPETMYRAEIVRRIKALEAGALDDAELDAPEWESEDDGGRGAKYEEMPFDEPFGFLTLNTRKKIHLAIAYGYDSTFNYDFGLEYAFRRNFSIYGHLRHWGHGIGFAADLGVKYAVVKDVRTGGLFVVGASLKAGADPSLLVGVDPFIGLGVCPRDKPVNLQFQVGFDMRFTPWHWDAHAGLNLTLKPSDKVHVFFEGTGHNFVRNTLRYDVPAGETCGDDGAGDEHCITEYYGFYEAAAGVKVFPKENVEITIAARAPVFYRKWQHYHPAGGGVQVLIYY